MTTKLHPALAKAFENMTPEEFDVLHEAISQYADNCDECDEKSIHRADVAYSFMLKMDAAHVAAHRFDVADGGAAERS